MLYGLKLFLKKKFNRTFFCLAVLASGSKSQLYLFKCFKKIKSFNTTTMTWRLQKHVWLIV